MILLDAKKTRLVLSLNNSIINRIKIDFNIVIILMTIYILWGPETVLIKLKNMHILSMSSISVQMTSESQLIQNVRHQKILTNGFKERS